jgi:hypothetical protein
MTMPEFTADHSELPLEFLDFPHFDDVQHHIMCHPQGLCAVHGYDNSPDWDALLDCGSEPGDPREKMRWQITREAFDSIKPFLKEREEHLKRYKRQRGYHASLAALKRRDPLYERTMHVMERLMGDLPQVVKELAMPVLTREFGPFLRLYEELRPVARTVENHYHNKRRRTKARQEGGGATPGAGNGERELRELVSRVKSGGAREGDLLRYIELMGGGR